MKLQVLLVVALLSLTSLAWGQESLHLHVDVTIGNGDQPEELFGHVTDVAVDSKGQIYVADGQAATIRVFSAEGTYLRSVGSRGRGPGEFQYPTGIYVDARDRLLVSDQMQARLVRFTSKGQLDEAHSVNRSLQAVLDIYPLPAELGEGYLMAAPSHERESTLYAYRADMNERLGRFFRGYPEEAGRFAFERIYRLSNPGSTWVGENEVTCAPGLYEGALSVYSFKDGEWIRSGKIVGQEYDAPAFESVEYDQADRERAVAVRAVNWSVAGYPARESRGLFRRPDGTLVHFVLVLEEDRAHLEVEMWSGSNDFLGASRVVLGDEGDAYPPRPGVLDVAAMDDEGRFYVIDRRADHVVHVGSLQSITALAP